MIGQIYASVVGIKVLNVVTNRVVRCMGSTETGERFLAVALYQVRKLILSLFQRSCCMS